MPDTKYCHECGKPFFIEENGIAHHTSDDGIDFDADADHVPFTLEPSGKMVSFDFIMDTFVAVEAPEGTDPETLVEQAKEKFMERLADGSAVVVFDSVFDE